MDNVYLMGSEAVERAGHSIARAAEEMSRAASTISETEQTLVRDMERTFGDWVNRIQEVLHPMLVAKAPADPLPTYPDVEKARSEWDPSAPALHVELRNILGIEPHQSIPPAIMILQASLKAVKAHEQEWLDAWKGVPAEDPADLRRQFDHLQYVNFEQAVKINTLQGTIEEQGDQLAGAEAQHEQDKRWSTDICALAELHGRNRLDGPVYDWISNRLTAHDDAATIITHLRAEAKERVNAYSQEVNRLKTEVERLRTVEAAAEISDTERRACQARAESAESRLKKYEEQHRESLVCWEDMEKRAESAEARVKELERAIESWREEEKLWHENEDAANAERDALQAELADAQATSNGAKRDRAVVLNNMEAVESELDTLRGRVAAYEQALDTVPPLPKFEHWHSDAYRAREIAQFATTMRGWFAQERAGRADLIKVAVLAERERVANMLAHSPKFGFFSNDGEGGKIGEGKGWWREKTAEILSALTPG